MRAAIIEAPGKVSVSTVPDPAPGPREVVVAVASVGLCGTDLHILQGEFAPTLPIVPGHEFAGEIVGIGREVTELAIGDRVAVDPSLHCHECRYCRIGRGNLCERWAAIGVTEPGGAAEYAVAPVANCVRLPEHIDVKDAALIEPLSCAVRGYDVLNSTLGAEVLIYGSGTMGLMMLELAKRTGAAGVDILDVNPDRLATAALLGCSRSAAGADELDRPGGWDVVIDATGNAGAIQDGLGRVAKGGTFLQFEWPTTRPGRSSSRTASTTTRSPSPVRWRSCTATNAPPRSSPPECSTRPSSSATGCPWSSTRRPSTASRRASAARSWCSRDGWARPRPRPR